MSLDGAAHFRALQLDRVKQIADIFKLPTPRQQELPKAEESKAPAPAAQRPSLDRILAAVENHFQLSRLILAGKGTDAEVVFPRAAFVSLALSYGYDAEAIGSLIRRTSEGVMTLHWPKKQMGPKQQKALKELQRRLKA